MKDSASQRSIIFVGIAGGTASGKTTLSRRLRDSAPDLIQVIEIDSYYKDQTYLSPSDRKLTNYDVPDATDFDLLASHGRALAQGKSIEVPLYDFACSNRMPGGETRHPSPIIIIEGILALHTAELRSLYAMSIFVDAPADVRFARRLERDVRERNRTSDSVRTQWESTVQPSYERYCYPSKQYADLVFDGQTLDESQISDLFQQIVALTPYRSR